MKKRIFAVTAIAIVAMVVIGATISHMQKGDNMSDINNLTGRVTALPQLDSTLTKAGFCADAKATGDMIAQYKEEINGDVAEKLSASDERLNAATTEMNANIEAFEKQITDDFAENISTLDARLTNLASLEEGSTTGDAELADIRVGADGTVYESAGDAVRGQVSDLKSELSDLSDYYVTSDNWFDNVFDESGYIDTTTGADAESTSYKRTSKYYPIVLSEDMLSVLHITLSTTVDPFVIVFYDENKTVVGYYSLRNKLSGSINAVNGYFRIYTDVSFDGSAYVGNHSFEGDYTYSEKRLIGYDGLADEVKDRFVNVEKVNNGNLFDNGFGSLGYIDVSTGKNADASGIKRTDGFYPFKAGTLYFSASVAAAPMVFLFYDANKQYIGYHSFNGVTQGQYAVPFDGYFRIYTDANFEGSVYFSTNVPEEPINYGYALTTEIVSDREKLTILNFGDSIIGNTQDFTSVSANLSRLRNDTVYNCGFGGCRMSVHKENWDKCSMYRIADCIYNNDFTDLVTSTQSGWSGMPNYFDETAKLLSELDFSCVDVITISYGTNDYREETSTLDNTENKYDTTTVCGALRYSIKQIHSKYPHIKILVTTPIFRTFLDDNNAVTSESDSKDWGSGTLLEYAEAIKNACKEMKIPCLDLYNESQLNEFTRLYYYPVDDGTHPNEKGRELIATLINGKLKTILR